jgi:predicted Zn-dependent peptidase
MINRTEAPELKQLHHIDFVTPKNIALENDAILHWINEVNDDAVKIDFIFQAGSIFDKKLVAKLTGDMLFSGTPDKTSSEINEAIDRLGGFTNVEVTAEDVTVSVLGLKENIDKLVAIVLDAIKNAHFDEKELSQKIQSKKQGMAISLQKVATQARRTFVKSLFDNTPYGKMTMLEDFEKIERAEIINFHRNYYKNGLQKIAVVGALEQNQIDRLIMQVKGMTCKERLLDKYDFQYMAENIHIEKEAAVQTAIRIGRILFNKTHADYIDFTILNTVLGGYFGSRLMSSIREDKGYTYGIGSGVAQMKQTGYFFISTEVGKEVKDDAIKAIQEEIELLQNKPLDDQELSLVKNYSIGQLLKNSDGPFAMMDRYLSVHKFGMELDYYDDVISHLQNITPDKIQALAKKYLKWEDLVVISAG